jgi:hypothetical protein
MSSQKNGMKILEKSSGESFAVNKKKRPGVTSNANAVDPVGFT